MTGTLMALVDGSAYSESVCRHAAWIARRTGAQVKLYHVLDPRRAPGQGDLSGAIRLGARTRLLEQLSELDARHAKLAQAHGRAILEDARGLLEAEGVEDVVTRLRNDDIVETVSRKEEAADMIVIGKRGEAADFEKLHLGSNFERIVRACHKPVFVANRAFRPIRKVLIAYDGGLSSLKAVDYVARNPLFEGLEVIVALAGGGDAVLSRGLSDAKATLAAGGHDADTRLLSGYPETALGDLVETEGIDLLVMGAYGHSRIRTLVIGSTTTAMIRTCKIPIVLMR
ncbi:nucleotide-binding universal stress UspA family protein [Rhodovulum imhoffii]|uniref:Nucleotide-binding universal stress UspA family protein n=1 Tax=Rhodovulum imhoffii TaxID=365340 RepID=A0A2T5BS85_9RHOB|nr:universal stress protein [Rhodovulum imhoffii]MBK5934758.1 universal stress protein UspA [Rhodovulum imhoffii]PTN02182.1 nucleotide-binding universal stress UspA family protein [Rhodovulum imhoffii]